MIFVVLFIIYKVIDTKNRHDAKKMLLTRFEQNLDRFTIDSLQGVYDFFGINDPDSADSFSRPRFKRQYSIDSDIVDVSLSQEKDLDTLKRYLRIKLKILYLSLGLLVMVYIYLIKNLGNGGD